MAANRQSMGYVGSEVPQAESSLLQDFKRNLKDVEDEKLFPFTGELYDRRTSELEERRYKTEDLFKQFEGRKEAGKKDGLDWISAIGNIIGYISDKTSGNKKLRDAASRQLKENLATYQEAEKGRAKDVRQDFVDEMYREELLGKGSDAIYATKQAKESAKQATRGKKMKLAGDLTTAESERETAEAKLKNQYRIQELKMEEARNKRIQTINDKAAAAYQVNIKGIQKDIQSKYEELMESFKEEGDYEPEQLYKPYKDENGIPQPSISDQIYDQATQSAHAHWQATSPAFMAKFLGSLPSADVPVLGGLGSEDSEGEDVDKETQSVFDTFSQAGQGFGSKNPLGWILKALGGLDEVGAGIKKGVHYYGSPEMSKDIKRRLGQGTPSNRPKIENQP